MRRTQLEHIVRAAGDIADDDEIIVVGSQAILGQYPDAPAELLVSNEADVYPKNKPERSDLIDGSIGEGSPSTISTATMHRALARPRAFCPPAGKNVLFRYAMRTLEA